MKLILWNTPKSIWFFQNPLLRGWHSRWKSSILLFVFVLNYLRNMVSARQLPMISPVWLTWRLSMSAGAPNSVNFLWIPLSQHNNCTVRIVALTRSFIFGLFNDKMTALTNHLQRQMRETRRGNITTAADATKVTYISECCIDPVTPCARNSARARPASKPTCKILICRWASDYFLSRWFV